MANSNKALDFKTRSNKIRTTASGAGMKTGGGVRSVTAGKNGKARKARTKTNDGTHGVTAGKMAKGNKSRGGKKANRPGKHQGSKQ